MKANENDNKDEAQTKSERDDNKNKEWAKPEIIYLGHIVAFPDKPKRIGFNPIVIVGIFPNPAGDDVQPQAGEYVVLENLSDSKVKLGGWRISYGEGYEAVREQTEEKDAGHKQSESIEQKESDSTTSRINKQGRDGERLVLRSLRLPFGTLIPPRQRLRVHTGPGRQTKDQVFCHRRRAVWKNEGGVAKLYDATDDWLQTFRYGGAAKER